MSINLTSTTAVTFASLTNKVFTFVKDLMNDGRSVRYLLSAMTGTGGITDVHNVDTPRTFLVRRPEQNRRPSRFNATSGRYDVVPRNTHVVTGQFAMKISATQTEIATFRCEMGIPAGAVQQDAAQIDSYVAMYFGALNSQAAGIIDSIKTGVL